MPQFNVSVCSYGVGCFHSWTITCVIIDFVCQVGSSETRDWTHLMCWNRIFWSAQVYMMFLNWRFKARLEIYEAMIGPKGEGVIYSSLPFWSTLLAGVRQVTPAPMPHFPCRFLTSGWQPYSQARTSHSSHWTRLSSIVAGGTRGYRYLDEASERKWPVRPSKKKTPFFFFFLLSIFDLFMLLHMPTFPHTHNPYPHMSHKHTPAH